MTKKDALNIVFSCAISYKENLAGRSLLFVTADKHIESTAKKVNILK